jgi:predicted small lipoprotein YifL
MTKLFLLLIPVLVLSACGVRRPLIAPKDIPAFEEKLRKKQQERDQFLREQEELRQHQLELEQQRPQQTPPPIT